MSSNKPAFRQLKGYTFDPSLSLKRDTAVANQIIYRVDWEDLTVTVDEKNKMVADAEYQPQGPGPIGEYIEVVDYDPTVGQFFQPVDLNDPYLLAQQGFAPSESNPMFHQQMVYAVIMTTIRNFERALGRKIIWSARRMPYGSGFSAYVQRLRVYPHAMREANAYYSPQKKALLFGYFSSTPADESLQMPNSLVFTCLSHDIVAHETTHAILDGIHGYYNEPSNPDVLAFHEAFADMIALFQHFTFADVLKQQIAETKGDLQQQNLLGKLAQQFGTAIGRYGSLRDALGEEDEASHEWKPRRPKADDYHRVREVHERGSILVAAVFEAFINIYKDRAADLLRIASNGTGILSQGELHPDLVNRLAREASKSARHVMNMCIRALDYCPPVDITFGDFLRAIITADLDLVADDDHFYRLTFIDAFRRRGIYPQGIKTLSIESLRYTLEPTIDPLTARLFEIITDFLRDFRREIMYVTDRKEIDRIAKEYIGGTDVPNEQSLHRRIFSKFEDSVGFERLTGLVFSHGWDQLGIRTSNAYSGNIGPSFQVQNLRVVSRVGPNGEQINEIIFSMVQTCGVLMEKGNCKGHFVPPTNPDLPEGGFKMRGGCALIFDLDSMKLKYAISKPLLDLDKLAAATVVREIDRRRIDNQYHYQLDTLVMGMNEYDLYFGVESRNDLNEPFAFLHQH